MRFLITLIVLFVLVSNIIHPREPPAFVVKEETYELCHQNDTLLELMSMDLVELSWRLYEEQRTACYDPLARQGPDGFRLRRR
jgi:hypothetical protein